LVLSKWQNTFGNSGDVDHCSGEIDPLSIFRFQRKVALGSFRIAGCGAENNILKFVKKHDDKNHRAFFFQR